MKRADRAGWASTDQLLRVAVPTPEPVEPEGPWEARTVMGKKGAGTGHPSLLPPMLPSLASTSRRQPASGERKEMQPAGQTCLQGESRWATLGAEGLRGASREDPARDDPQGPPGTREHSRNPAGILCAKAVDIQKSSTGRARKREHRK